MIKQNAPRGLIGLGILSAIAASLCCITPVLALIAGSSGLASAFSWLEPARPYLIGLTVLVIGFAWYLKLKPKPVDECGCDIVEKPAFVQSKTFLGIVTAFAALMLAFPYYSHSLFPKSDKKVDLVVEENVRKAEFVIDGMTCTGCEKHVNREVNKLSGIISANTSYKLGIAVVEFDHSQTNIAEIEKAINSTGYRVTKSVLKN